jgi:AAA15 family ATPase/GTPase
MLNFHFCTKFQKQIEQEQFKQDLLKKLDTLTRLDDLKQNSSSAKVQTFAGETIFVFKYKETVRVLIEKRKIETDTVYFVRELIINAKEHFWTTQDFPRIKNGYWINDNPLTQTDIDNYCAIPKQDRQINKKALPYEKKTWLDDFKIIIKHQIFETEKWVEYVSLEDAPKSMQPNDQKDFHRLVKFIYEQTSNNSTVITKETLINNQSVEIVALQHHEYGLGIIYALFELEDEKQLLLFNGANFKKQKTHWENIKRKASDYQQIVIKSYDDLAKNSLRSYPKSILNDFDSWLTIQSGSELSNLCLLQEQTKYLQDFKFPAYINAQAGSGKSTILYYLFAHTYWVKCMSKDSINQVGKVIFLTENEYLLNKFTKPAIKSLLSNNADLMGLPEEDLLAVDDCFATFKIFLWNLLDEDLKKDFLLTKYLDFSTFKNKYENAKYFNGKLKYTAEEAWFIINTYIRGYDNNKDIVNFEEIKPTPVEFPADFFTDILKEIYQNFYKKLLEDGYWDKAKAIRYINQYNSETPKYSAIFCDEAQDFSRASLEFIVQQSEFLEFDLADNEVVPIVFAGDHTQTVDPTGFSVARTKDIFYSQLKSKLQRESYIPEYNYRSARAVVNLANIIQYYRKKVLGIDIQKPQKSKKVEPIEGYTQNVFLSYDKLTDKTIKQKLRYKAFIIPTDASNKDNFLRENSFFEWNTENKQAVFHNIQTAIEAKGVDFKQVVVVGFGDFYLKEFQTLSWESSNFENIFEEKYFFNKLYVAITRAQNELIIVDSDEAYQQFWEKLRLPNQINDGWEDLRQTQDNILIKADNIIPSKEEDEIESVNITKQQAIAEKNANGLRLVALRFYRLGDEKQYLDCLALSEELKGNWGEAAKLYEKLGLKDDILEKRSNCYFKAQQWEDLLKITTLKTDQHLTRCVIANLMTNHFARIKPNAINDYKNTLAKLLNEIEWAKSLATSLIKYLTYLKENTINFILTSLAIKELNVLTNPEMLHQIALLHFEAKNNAQAKDFWNLVEEGDKEKPCKEYLENLVLYYGQQGEIESKIISIGKLLEYKLPQIELQQYQDQVLAVATTQLHNLPTSFAFIQVLLKVLIIKHPNENEILILITQLEKIALQENNIRLLKSYYENLLEEVTLPIYLAEFIVERWAKSIILLPHKSTDWLSKLNEKYKEYSKLHQLNFQAFTEQELTEIITTPKQIHKQLSEHFEHITILNFRRFKIIELKNLGKFNLIVGDNNVGKTSLLEALLFTPEEQVFTRRLAYAYWERTHDFIPIIKDTFWEDFIYANDIQNYKMSFIVTQQRSKFEFEPTFTDLKAPLSVADSVNTQLIPFGKGFGKELAEIYYANIEDAEDEIAENFIKNMQSFIPNINRIIANAKTGEIKLREKGLDIRLPLHQYGEGANKLFRIILQMLLNKGGRILIDEIDAGIHFSRIAKFWEVILEVAAKNKIQVFATTHNLECVQYFKEVLEKENFKNLASQARTITLFQDKYKQVQARTRNFEAFQEAIDEGYNIRGGE